MALSVSQIQNAYVAFFNRPADVAGLNYWSSYAGSSSDLLRTFAQQSEYTSLFTGLNNTQAVNLIYNNLFGRDADLPGLNYWVGQLENGKVTVANIADAVNKGAQGSDSTIIVNKTTAATSFTNSLDTVAEVVAYASVTSSGLAAVKTWLSGVTTDASLTTATSSTALTAIISNVSSSVTEDAGLTFTLTTDADTVTGGTGDDVIFAKVDAASSVSTLDDSDSVDGGAGSDIINVTLNDAAATLAFAGTLANVETLKISAGGVATGAGTAATLDISAAEVSGLEVVRIYANKDIDVSFTAADLTDVVFEFDKLGTGSVAISATSANAATLSLDFLSSASAASISFTGDTGSTTITTLDITIADDVAFTALDITSGTGASTDTITTVTVAGTGDIDFTNAAAVTSAAALTLVDASALEGGITLTYTGDTLEILGGTGDNAIDITGDSVTVTTQGGDDAITVTGDTAVVTAGSGDDAVSVTGSSATVLGGSGDDTITAAASGTVDLDGGAGDDTIDISASTDDVSSSDTIDGGDGTDTIVINVLDAAATLTLLENFEQIVFASTNADSATIDATSLTAFSSIGVAGDAAVSFTNVDGETFTVADSGTITVVGASTSSKVTDSVTIDVTGESATAQAAIDITVDEIETLTLNITAVSSTAASGVTIASLDIGQNGGGATTVVINIDGDTAASTVNVVTITAGTLEVADLTLNIAAAGAVITALSQTAGSVFDLSVSGDGVSIAGFTSDAATSGTIDISGASADVTIEANAAESLSVDVSGDSASVDIGASGASVVSLDVSGSSNAVTLDISAATDITIDISGDAVTLNLGAIDAVSALAITTSGDTDVVNITSATAITALDLTVTSGDLAFAGSNLDALTALTISGGGAIDVAITGAATEALVVDLSGFSGTLDVLDLDSAGYTAATITIGDATGARARDAGATTTGAILLDVANAVVDTIAFTSTSASGVFNIDGFDESEDQLDLTAFGITKANQLTLSDDGTDLTITAGDGEFDFTICLLGVLTADFDNTDLA